MYSSDTSFVKIGPVINEEKQSQKVRLNINRPYAQGRFVQNSPAIFETFKITF